MKITKYGLVCDLDSDNFVKSINQKIEEGWQPIGGITVCVDISSENDLFNNKIAGITSSNFFYQAMVRYE